MNRKKTAEELRSHRWYGATTCVPSATARAPSRWATPREDYRASRSIAIINTWSDLNPCHGHFRERAEEVKRGVWQAGGFPVELPAMSLSETFQKPSTMLYRNLLAMETEELLRSHPDRRGGADGRLRQDHAGAADGRHHVDVPAIFVPAGRCCAATGAARSSAAAATSGSTGPRSGPGTSASASGRRSRTASPARPGHCMTMGTASTMTAVAEALGMTLPGASSIPAVDSDHPRMAAASGRRIVEMVWEDLKPSDILTTEAYDNAVTAVLAIGGSTNAVIHLIAMAGARRASSTSTDSTTSRADAGARQPPSERRVPHGGLLLRRRIARPARPARTTGCTSTGRR